MQLREDIKRGVYLEGLAEVGVRNRAEALDILAKGLVNRHTGATSMNLESSRSHSVFTLSVNSQTSHMGVCKSRHSQFHFVDLAGSERQKKTETTGERLKEGCNINKSLSVLGSVINALVESAAGKKSHIRYRDSKLTFLLRDSLGGNSRTTMVANVSPAPSAYHETLSTLQFAQRAKLIKTHAFLNEDMEGGREALQLEIRRLKDELSAARSALIENQRSTAMPLHGQLDSDLSENEKLRRALDSTMSALMETNAHLRCEVEKKAEILKNVDNCFAVMQTRELEYNTALRLKADQDKRFGIEPSFRVIETFDYKLVAENLILKERLWRLEQVKPQFELAHSLCMSTGISSKAVLGDCMSIHALPTTCSGQLDHDAASRDDKLPLDCGNKEKTFDQVAQNSQGDRCRPQSGSEYQLPPDVEAELEGMRLDLMQSDEEKESLLSSLDYLKDALERQADTHAEELAKLRCELEQLRGQAKLRNTDLDLVQQLEEAKSESIELASKLSKTEKERDDLMRRLELSTQNANRLEHELIAMSVYKDQLVSALANANEQITLQNAKLDNEIETGKQLSETNKVLQMKLSLMSSDIDSINSLLKERNEQLQTSESQRAKLEVSIGNQLVIMKQKDADFNLANSYLQKQQAINEDLEKRLAKLTNDRNAAVMQFNALQNALALIVDALESSDSQAVFGDLIAATSFKQQATLMKKALVDRERLLFTTRQELELTKANFRCQIAALKKELDVLEVDYDQLQSNVHLIKARDTRLLGLHEKPLNLDYESKNLEDCCRHELQHSVLVSNLNHADRNEETKSRIFKPNMMAVNRSPLVAGVAVQSKHQVLVIDSPKKQLSESPIQLACKYQPSDIGSHQESLPADASCKEHRSKVGQSKDLDVQETTFLGKREELATAAEIEVTQDAISRKRATSEFATH